MRLLPNEQPQILASGTSGSLEDVVSTLTVIPIVLFMICGLFSGAFIVALLFRRIAIALAVAGPLVFSAIWIWRGWGGFPKKKIWLRALFLGFTLTFPPSCTGACGLFSNSIGNYLEGETNIKN